MELRQLAVFAAVAEHGTVTDAAAALGLAPSSVSAQVRALERSLGVALFARSGRGMTQTPAGARLLGWSHRLLAAADQARREVAESAAPLRLGALETIAARYVPGVLGRVEARGGPSVQVRTARDRSVLLAEVLDGRLAAALLLDTGDALGELGFPVPPEPLEFADVAPVPLALVAAGDHRLAGRSDLDVAQLAGERLLVNAPGCSFGLAADAAFGSALERVRLDGVAVLRAWAERGLGVTLLPTFAVADALAAGTLAALALPVPTLALRLVWRAHDDAAPGVRELLYAASSGDL